MIHEHEHAGHRSQVRILALRIRPAQRAWPAPERHLAPPSPRHAARLSAAHSERRLWRAVLLGALLCQCVVVVLGLWWWFSR